MDLNFKCPLCETYFDAQDDLQDHVKAAHTSYYYDTYLVPPMIIGLPDPVGVVAPVTVITTEPVGSPDVIIEPVVVDDGCDCCGCCSCCSDQPVAAGSAVDGGDGCCDCCGGTDAGGGGDCGDCDCDCDCVIM
ncbi:hypothetical protein quinque_007107 [Culex quinquefasciatus]|uniref:uncharacterized protein LOC6044280 n=1 Tax=Culex quinquefasciatus TaxID=7176 RepID=UPI0018E2AA37|nr:uncharacterized protein LOC6044280 [Culex quinquefasciatus]